MNHEAGIEEKSALRSEWTLKMLGEICDVILGQSPPGTSYNMEGKGLPFFQGKAEFGDLYPKAVKWCTEPSKVAEKDDVLISVRAPVGPSNLCPEQACIGRGLAALRPRNGISSRYVLYAIRSNVRSLVEQATGSTFDAISGSQLRAHTIPLAPVKERETIVAEIEKQFTRLDAGVASLKRVQTALKRYRASVLKAACEGHLVPTEAELARKENRTYETGEQLLHCILEARREKWNGKGKYKEPTEPRTADLLQLAEGWTWATVSQLSGIIVDCPHSTAKFVANGLPCVDTTCIKPGRIVREKLRYVSPQTYEERVQRLIPESGDIIFAREGTVGTAAVVPPDFRPCLGQRVMLMRSDTCVIPAFLEHCLNSSVVRQQYLPKIVGSTAPHLNVAEVKTLAIPLPPLVEQYRIVEEVESRLSVIEELETVVSIELQRASRLRRSILKRAFRGS
jgi:type I restriction enzyme S subunit